MELGPYGQGAMSKGHEQALERRRRMASPGICALQARMTERETKAQRGAGLA